MIFRRDDDEPDPVEATAPATARREEQMAEQMERSRSSAPARASRATSCRPGRSGSTVRSRGRSMPRATSPCAPRARSRPTSARRTSASAAAFKGNITVKGKAHLARGGRIDGNITSKTLVVEEGGIFHGQSIMDGARPRPVRPAPRRARRPQLRPRSERNQVKVP